MKNYIPTIEELLTKPERELEAIFRNAAAIAGDTTRLPQEQAAASRTIENVRRCRIQAPRP